MRLPFGCAVVSAVLSFALGSGCLARSGHVAVAVDPVKPAAVAAATGPFEREETTAGKGAPRQKPTPVEVEARGPIFDASAAVFVLDEQAWSAARAPYLALDFAEASNKLSSLVATAAPQEAARGSYQLGRLRLRAGDFAGAARAFDDAATVSSWPLVPYARFAAAQAYVRAGLLTEGMARAQAIPDGLAITGAARLLVAEALEAKRDSAGALEIYDAYLSENRHPPRWAEIAVRAAEALLTLRPLPEHAERAARLARRVLIEAPTAAGVERAIAIERKAYAMIGEAQRMKPLVPHGPKGKMLAGDWATALSPSDQLARATAFADAQNYRDASAALEALLARVRVQRGESEVTCKAEFLSAVVLGKLRESAKSAAAYDRALGRCSAYPDVLVEVLYQGAKSSVSGGRCEEAMERFGRVEKEFHDHRYADDARLRGAECALSLGDTRRYEEMLGAIADDYPNGDMDAEGLFRLAVHRAGLGMWSQALEALSRGEGIDARESPRGRFPYFKARALAELGDTEGAARAYADVVRHHPLSYYALHAYSRLSEIDPKSAQEIFDAALAAEPPGRFSIADSDRFHSGAFARGTELLGEGEVEWARKELGTALKDDADSDSLWAAVLAYSRAGLVRESHWLAKTRVLDWLSHYPVGRWRDAWELAYPRPFASVVEREAEKSGIPAALAYAIMREESAFDADAVSPARAYGLMQLIVPTAKHVAKGLGLDWTPGSLSEPEVNVKLGCKFLSDLRSKFSGNPHLAVSAYNAGPGAPLRWISTRTSDAFDLWVEQIPFEETRRYTKRVLTSFAAYSFLSGGEGAVTSLRFPARVVPD